MPSWSDVCAHAAGRGEYIYLRRINPVKQGECQYFFLGSRRAALLARQDRRVSFGQGPGNYLIQFRTRTYPQLYGKLISGRWGLVYLLSEDGDDLVFEYQHLPLHWLVQDAILSTPGDYNYYRYKRNPESYRPGEAATEGPNPATLHHKSLPPTSIEKSVSHLEISLQAAQQPPRSNRARRAITFAPSAQTDQLDNQLDNGFHVESSPEVFEAPPGIPPPLPDLLSPDSIATAVPVLGTPNIPVITVTTNTQNPLSPDSIATAVPVFGTLNIPGIPSAPAFTASLNTQFKQEEEEATNTITLATPTEESSRPVSGINPPSSATRALVVSSLQTGFSVARPVTLGPIIPNNPAEEETRNLPLDTESILTYYTSDDSDYSRQGNPEHHETAMDPALIKQITDIVQATLQAANAAGNPRNRSDPTLRRLATGANAEPLQDRNSHYLEPRLFPLSLTSDPKVTKLGKLLSEQANLEAAIVHNNLLLDDGRPPVTPIATTLQTPSPGRIDQTLTDYLNARFRECALDCSKAWIAAQGAALEKVDEEIQVLTEDWKPSKEEELAAFSIRDKLKNLPSKFHPRKLELDNFEYFRAPNIEKGERSWFPNNEPRGWYRNGNGNGNRPGGNYPHSILRNQPDRNSRSRFREHDGRRPRNQSDPRQHRESGSRVLFDRGYQSDEDHQDGRGRSNSSRSYFNSRNDHWSDNGNYQEQRSRYQTKNQ